MSVIPLGPIDLALAAILVLAAAALSWQMRLGIERQMAVAALRTTVQLLLVGLVLRALFAHVSLTWVTLIALIMLALRGELGAFARRWGRTLFNTLTSRRIAYEPPTDGSLASGGIPFAAAIAVGLAAQWYGGSPW